MPIRGASIVMIPTSPAIPLAAIQGRSMKESQKAVQESLAASTTIAQRVLSNLTTFRILGAEARQLDGYQDAVQTSLRHAQRVGKDQAMYDASVAFAMNSSLCLVFAFGGQQVLDGTLTAGGLSSFLMYSMYLGFSTSQLSR